MFPTAGYFRSVPCPFYIHGLCHRPYCHFRHSKPDTKGKRTGNHDWTYGEVVAEEEDVTEVVKSKEEEQLMNIIKNLSPGKKKESASTSSKKSVTFSLFTEKDKKGDIENSAYETTKQSTEELDKKKKELSRKIEKAQSDPIPAPIVQEISDLLKITNENDQSSVIADELRKRKRSKKEPEETITEVDENIEIKVPDDDKIDDNNIFDFIEDEVPKKPPKLKDINFFEIDTEESTKPAKKKKNKPERTAGKVKNEKNGSSIESSGESVDNSEATLRRIFDDYDPLNDSDGNDDTAVQGYGASKVIETVGAGSLKRRIAHNPNIEAVRQPVSKKGLPRRALMKPSYVSPSITTPSQTAGNAAKSSEAEKVSKRMSFTTDDGTYIGKKRKAHIMGVTDSTEVKDFSPAKKPRIPVEFGSKVPQMIRQRYLDKIIEEYTGKFETLQEVYNKAVEEEKLIYSRCTSRQIYMNLCVNSIKRIREVPNFKKEASGNPMETAKPTIRRLSDSSSKIAAHLASSIVPPKVVIRPSTISLANLDKKHSSLSGGSKEAIAKQRKASVTSAADLTEDAFYDYMLKYIATDQDMWENNYPRESTETSGLAEFKEIRGSMHPTKRSCARCGKPFQLNEEGEYENKVECHYHWGKLRRMRGRAGAVSQFSCCQGEAGSQGCCVAKLHVSDYWGDLDDYVVTKSHNRTNTRKVYALDCEMCYTSHGLELTRVTIVDFKLKQVLDAFVKPNRKIIDYNTRFSGVTAHDLEDVQITLQDVHRKLLKKFSTDTILVGHSLESDLRALKLIHRKVVDTALIFPHRLGLPYKRALKTLMGEFLQKIIQDNDGGHDSYEDSAACMELMKWKINEDLKKQARTSNAHVR